MGTVFVMLLLGVIGWMMWMATCRPEQWEKLVENDRRRKRETLRGALKLGGIALKTYRHGK